MAFRHHVRHEMLWNFCKTVFMSEASENFTIWICRSGSPCRKGVPLESCSFASALALTGQHEQHDVFMARQQVPGLLKGFKQAFRNLIWRCISEHVMHLDEDDRKRRHESCAWKIIERVSTNGPDHLPSQEDVEGKQASKSVKLLVMPVV